MFDISDSLFVTLVGFAGGTALGLAGRMARFCTLGAIEDALYGGSRERMLMWPMALGVAIIATFGLAAFGLVAMQDSIYLRYELSISAAIVGGLMFGLGMALAGNCGFGALVRLGGGDIRSLLIVLVIGIVAYMTATGPLAELRQILFPRVQVGAGSPPGLAHWVAEASGVSPALIAAPIGLALIVYALFDRHFLDNRPAVFWSTMVGLAIASGWWGTTWAAARSFEIVAVESHTFTMPLGEVLLQAMRSTSRDGGFSVGSVLGVLFGAFLGSHLRRQFRWEACDDPGELRRQIFGAALMGAGGVIALGCSIGQGMSAFSVLAISAPITTAAIGIGAVVGLRYLVEGPNIGGLLKSGAGRIGRLFHKPPDSS
jgi:hypothetical protein